MYCTSIARYNLRVVTLWLLRCKEGIETTLKIPPFVNIPLSCRRRGSSTSSSHTCYRIDRQCIRDGMCDSKQYTTDHPPGTPVLSNVAEVSKALFLTEFLGNNARLDNPLHYCHYGTLASCARRREVSAWLVHQCQIRERLPMMKSSCVIAVTHVGELVKVQIELNSSTQ